MTLRLLSLLTFALVLGQTTEQDASPLASLTAEQQQVLESLSYNTFLEEVANNSQTLSVEVLEQVMNDIQSGINEEEHDSEDAGVLELTPELLLDQYGSGSTSLNRRQFLQSTFMITSCLMNQNCVLESHDNHDDHDHEDHEDHDDHHDDDDDDDTTVVKVIALLVLFFESIFGALVPITMNTSSKLDEVLSIINCFSGGVLLTTGIVHLIPHVVEYEELEDGIGDYPVGLLLIVASFVLVFFIEHILFDVHSHTDAHGEGSSETQLRAQEKETEKDIESMMHRVKVLKQGLVILAATSFHSILEAFVIGIEDETYDVWLLFGTVAAHKGVTAMALGSRMQKAGATLRESLILALLFALTAPVSILIGTAMSNVPNTVNLIFTGMSTGVFLYIGAYEVISEEFHEKPKHLTDPNNAPTAAHLKKIRYLKFVAIVIGVLCIAAAAFIPHHHSGHDDHNH